MPLLVAIDVPPETPAEYAAAMAGSCNAALGEGSCVASRGSPEPPSPSLDELGSDDQPSSEGEATEQTTDSTEQGPIPPWVAVVRWDDEAYRTLRIELRPATEQPPVEARVVAFTPADPPRQRWASAGLVVAALVSRRETIPRPPLPPPPPEPPPLELPPPPLPPEPPHPWARVDLGGVAGPGLDWGQARLGGLLRVSVVPSVLPLAFQAEARFAARGGQPTVRWVDGALGAIVRLGSWRSDVAVELHGDAVVQRMWLMADDPTRDETDVEKRWRSGGRLGGEVAYEFAAPAAVFLGIEGSILRPEVIISIGGDDLGNEPVVRWAGTTGLRVSF